MRLATVGPHLIGLRLGKTVFGPDGRPLLKAGVELTEGLVESLVRRGFTTLYVEDALTADIQFSEAVAEETRSAAMAIVTESLQRVKVAGHLDGVNLTELREVAQKILTDLGENGELLAEVSLLRSRDDATFTHSVNMAILCLLMGQALGYGREDLLKLGQGALLHDLGKMEVLHIITKPAALSPQEFEEVKRHAAIGYELLRSRTGASILAAHVALQHHERLDGSGYPRGLAGTQIHDFGRLAAVADVFDAATAPRRYRTALTPLEAAALIRSLAGSKLDPQMVRTLLSRLALYPRGSILVLNGGRVGVVVGQHPELPDRPLVRVITDEDGNLVPPRDVDLSADRTLQVQAVLTDYPARVYEQLRRLPVGDRALPR